MNKTIKIIKSLAAIIFIASWFYFFWYKVSIDDKNIGSPMNGKVIMEDDKLFLKNNDGNFCEVTKEQLDMLIFTTNIFKICIGYIIVYLIYLEVRLFIFNMKKRKQGNDKGSE